MALTFDWTIECLDCLPQSGEGADYVVTAHWRLVGVDGDYRGTVYGACAFPVVQGETFVPYADLTLDVVLGWCWANGVDKAACETTVAEQVEAQKNPPIVSPPLPWASA